MRGRSATQLAQAKERDDRISLLCKHLHAAIDVFEQIAKQPIEAPPKEVEPTAAPPIPPPSRPPQNVPREKRLFTIKEAIAVMGVGRTTLYAAIGDGRLTAVKLGTRTLIVAESLHAWIASLPRVRHRRE